MNCFQWQNLSSDYLDGTLNGPDKKDADAHLESCEGCGERYKHFRLILTSIAGQPRIALPAAIRKAPLSVMLPKMDVSRSTRSRWERMPWYLRAAAEGTGIVLVIMLAIAGAPKVRQFYERNVEERLGEFDDNFSASNTPDISEDSNVAAVIPAARGKAQPATGAADAASEGHDDFASEGEHHEDAVEAEGDTSIQVGKSEVWRFNLKTDSPHELRPKVVALLTELKIPPSTPGIGGIEAPGGIQFDLLLLQNTVPALRLKLQKLAPKAPEGLGDSPFRETFTWYKNKSRRKIPDGRTRVVIWISQM